MREGEAGSFCLRSASFTLRLASVHSTDNW
jgi:hypothetical protein